MKILLAPDSFKGSLSSVQVCEALRVGVERVRPDADCVALPLADGGEGTTAALVTASGGRLLHRWVTGPLAGGPPVQAFFGLLDGGRSAVIEMAAASGLPLLHPEQRDPRHTTTYGTGELVAAALDEGARRLILAVGGSASHDLGTGLAQALGVRFRRADGSWMDAVMTGAALVEVAGVDLGGLLPALAGSSIVLAADVDNPLLGPTGAAAVYGPQKGATPAIVAELEAGTTAAIGPIEAACGRRLRDLPGAGAAGGLGAALMGFLGATPGSGIDLVLEACGFETHLAGASLVLSGEGRLDGQTLHGKTIGGLARRCSQAGVPLVVIAGALGEGSEALYSMGVTSMVSLVPGPMTLEAAMAASPALLADAAERVLRLFLATDPRKS
jgi:glycerate 2-kinase